MHGTINVKKKFVSSVCCVVQIEASATGRFLVQGYSTECVCVCVSCVYDEVQQYPLHIQCGR